MISIQKWKCSWSLIATIVSVGALVSAAPLFLFPVLPFLDCFNVRNSSVPINGTVDERNHHHVLENFKSVLDLEPRFPVDLHGVVVHWNAPWKAEIGRWLSVWDSATKDVTVVESREMLILSRWKNLVKFDRLMRLDLDLDMLFLSSETA
ncbi:PREDICTED: uncharacterized protein LOC105131831 [Populus euphratica]|uniref:Uncharacterized protein LOC105131831 n=1 Tax=Populus euphratica TaxID=75702 RepID=A0AAJ6UPV6_POPEU|nr:PREDICTED: uncharacterized protein LOC105131831 [Populus euphratica]